MEKAQDLLTPVVLDIISHEVRTPLAAIKGYTSTLLRFPEQIAARERAELLHEIDIAGDRLQRVLERLLLLAEIAGEHADVMTMPVAIGRVVTAAISRAEQPVPDAPDRPVIMTLASPEGPVSDALLLVTANERLLGVLLDELLENAKKFSPPGGTITIQMHVVEPVGDHAPDASPLTAWLKLSIHDTGIGIPVDQLETIFAPFAVVDATLTRMIGGMGIGLALCRRIATLCGGRLWAENHDLQGSSFHLMLPLCS